MALDLKYDLDAQADELNALDGLVYQTLPGILRFLRLLSDVCTRYPGNIVDGAGVD